MRQARILFWLAAMAAMTATAACAPDGGDDDHAGNDGGGGGDDDDTDASGGGPVFIDAGEFGDGGIIPPPTDGCDKMDILFVVDNSGSMAEEQENLAANFPMFIDVIENYMTSAGVKLDYRVAITTTDTTVINDTIIGPLPLPGNDGVFVTNGCAFPGGRKYLQRGDTNVGATFACAAEVGIDGSGMEMPLEVAKLALIDKVSGPNAGFLREDALLAIVFVTDENDCSLPNAHIPFLSTPDAVCAGNIEPVSNYLAKFDSVKGGIRAKWATAVIAGPGPGVCESDFGSADESVRLKEFVQGVGTNAVFSSICDGNLAASLTTAFDKFAIACENIPDPD